MMEIAMQPHNNCVSGCFFTPRRSKGPRKRKYGLRPRHQRLYEALESAGWGKNHRLFASLCKAKSEAKSTPTLPPGNLEALRLLQEWRADDSNEQIETWEYLRRALDEDRLSDRKLSP